MGNCLNNSKQNKPAPAPETESRKRRRSENKSKRVHFDTHVEVFGREYDIEEEKDADDNKAGIKEQVRIRITKKQLEELLSRAELESLSVHEMMSCLVKEHLIDVKDGNFGECQSPLESQNLQV